MQVYSLQEKAIKYIVGVADMKVSANPNDTLITYALGSCLGITIHDPVACVGGLLHVMLPSSIVDPGRAKEDPFMFVDTGFPRLFEECQKAGAVKEHMVLKVAGGACAHGNEEDDYFQIGKRNFIMLKKLLWQNGLLLKAYDIGGSCSRTMSLDVCSGSVLLKINGITKVL
jgi:chemotaxis protein CheD